MVVVHRELAPAILYLGEIENRQEIKYLCNIAIAKRTDFTCKLIRKSRTPSRQSHFIHTPRELHSVQVVCMCVCVLCVFGSEPKKKSQTIVLLEQVLARSAQPYVLQPTCFACLRDGRSIEQLEWSAAGLCSVCDDMRQRVAWRHISATTTITILRDSRATLFRISTAP